MTSIVAKTRYSDSNGTVGYIKVAVTVVVGAGLALFSYFSFENMMALGILLFSTILVLLVVMMPPEDISVTLTREGVYFDRTLLPWRLCHSWVIVDLGDKLEFMIQTTNFDTSYYYFYADLSTENIQEFITVFSQILPYNELMEEQNYFHKSIRFLGLC